MKDLSIYIYIYILNVIYKNIVKLLIYHLIALMVKGKKKINSEYKHV